MHDESPDDEFLTRVAAYIAARDLEELRDLQELWGPAVFAEVAIYAWSSVSLLKLRLDKLKKWGEEPGA